MGILVVWGMIVVAAVALLAAWLLGLPLALGRGVDPGLVALGVLVAAVIADSVFRLRARWRR
jgi:hypothetical protein